MVAVRRSDLALLVRIVLLAFALADLADLPGIVPRSIHVTAEEFVGVCAEGNTERELVCATLVEVMRFEHLQ